MSEHLRERLEKEMGAGDRPTVDGLVTNALERGRHQRRMRRVAAGAGTTAVVGVTVLAVSVGAALAPGRTPSTSTTNAAGAGSVAAQVAVPATTQAVSATTQAAPATTKASAATKPARVVPKAKVAATTAGGDGKDQKMAAGHAWHALQAAASAANPPHWTAAPGGVAATPQGELQLFTDLVKPYAEASYYGVAEGADRTAVRAWVTTPDGGKGQVNFSLAHDTLGHAADCLQAPASFEADYGVAAPALTCHDSADGGYVITEKVNGGCLEDQNLTFVHPDGTEVAVTIATCQTDNANVLTPGSRTLTADQAEKIFTNPGFDFTMPAAVVDRGAALGTLPTFW